MHISLKWLKQYIKEDLPLDNDELRERISLSLTEADGIYPRGQGLEKIIIGKILEQHKHPDSKKLTVVQIDTGNKLPLQIVHGASNTNVGDLVPVALPGAKVFNSKDPLGRQKLVDIDARKLGGIMSNGMLCSMKELGLNDEHKGIFILPESEVIGDSIVEMIEDSILEIENKHLTHRGDCFSHIGIAREISAITNTKFESTQHYQSMAAHADLPLSVEIKNEKLCKRYTAVSIKGVTIKPSPLWLQLRLLSIGIRPINNIVDITNYVMFDLGQPLHAFDYDTIKSAKILVRNAKEGEKLKTLDGVERILTSDMLVIADAQKAIALAGIMGGEDTEITEHTKDIVIESANFEMYNNRSTTRKLGLRTEASTRYEKGIDPNTTLPGLQQAVAMIINLAGGEVGCEIIDVYPEPVKPLLLEFEVANVKRLIGIDLPKTELIKILEHLELKVIDAEKSLTSFTLEIPTFRKDITIKEDVIEEIARIHGYDRLIPTLPKRNLKATSLNPRREFLKTSKILLSGLGFDEIYSYSFVGEKLFSDCLMDITKCIRIKNPISPELEYIRNTLAPSLLDKLKLNSTNFTEYGLFEIAKVAIKGTRDKEILPLQPYHMSAGYFSKNLNETQTYEMIKNLLYNYMSNFKLSDIKIVNINNSKSLQQAYPFLHPGKSGAIYSGKQMLGVIGIIHPLVKENIDINGQLSIIEIDLEEIIKLSTNNKIDFHEVSQFQYVKRDISIWVDERTESQSILDAISNMNEKMIKEIEIIDVYIDNKNKGRKSYTIRIAIEPQEQTLTDEQIDKIIDLAKSNLQSEIAAELR